ncbi:hypothetical protein ACFLRP_04180 [Bacteroidota bacterium]
MSTMSCTTLSITEEQKADVIQAIMDYPEVHFAAIEQEETKLFLILMVADATSAERAMQLGDDFVRLMKSVGLGKPPGEKIGPGLFDYVIRIYIAYDRPHLFGVKSKRNDVIEWQHFIR